MIYERNIRKFTNWCVINLSTLTERHVITFRKQLINLLYQPTWAILVKLGEINMTPLISLSKIQRFITGKNVSYIIYKYMIIYIITGKDQRENVQIIDNL